MQPAPVRDQELEVHWRHILQLLAQAAGERARAEGLEHGVAAPDPRALEEGQLGEDGASSSSSSQTDPASPAGGRRGQGGSGNGPAALLPLWRQPAQALGNSQGAAGRGFLSQLSRRTQAAAASAVAAAASLSAGQGDDASVSASAEHYRLTNENGGVSAQALAEWAADLIPFLLLLIWVFIFGHFGCLLLIAWLTAALLRLNSVIRRHIAMRKEPCGGACCGQAAYVLLASTGVLWGLGPVFGLPGAVAVWAPQPPQLDAKPDEGPRTLDCLLLVLLADSWLRFASMAPKLLLVAWFRSRSRQADAAAARGAAGGGGTGGGSADVSSRGLVGSMAGARVQRQQSRVLTAVEAAVGLYRVVLPVPIWYRYLLSGASSSPVMACAFTGCYLTLKAAAVVERIRVLALALRTATRQGALYGTYVGGRGDEEAGGGGGMCPVCQDPVQTAVRLECGHVFCEECILEWLERDRTCPMCRANVRPAGLPSASDGASPLLPQLF